MLYTINTFGLSQRHQSFLVVNRAFPAVKRARNVIYEAVDDRSHLLDGTFRVHRGYSMDYDPGIALAIPLVRENRSILYITYIQILYILQEDGTRQEQRHVNPASGGASLLNGS